MLPLDARPWIAASMVALAACGASPRVELCGEIPEDGCPVGRGGTCDDALCAALYDCVEGDWTEVERCPGGGEGGSAQATGTGTGAGGCDAPTIDRAGEADGCTPDLQHPDCPVAAAETCTPCQSDCTDFWLCLEGGWEAVAYCDGGELIVEAAR